MSDDQDSFKIEDNKFICLRCDEIISLELPMSIEKWSKLMKKLAREHKNCKMAEK